MGLTYKLEKGLKKVVKNVFSKIVQNRIKIIWNSKNFIFSPDFGHFRGWVGVLNQIWRIRDLFFFNPIPLLLLNRWVSAKLAPALPSFYYCKILTLGKIFEFYFRNFFFHKTKVALNYEKIKVKRSQTWPPS